MLKARILTAVVALCVVLAALFLLPPVGFALFALVLLAVGAHEWARLAGFARGMELAFVVVFVAAGLLLVLWPGAGFARGWPPATVLTVCGTATLFWLLIATPWVVSRWQARARPMRRATPRKPKAPSPRAASRIRTPSPR